MLLVLLFRGYHARRGEETICPCVALAIVNDALLIGPGFVQMKRVYIETTVVSYLAAWPSRDLLQVARQRITYEWWSRERFRYDLCTSQLVLDEASAGDPSAALRRLEFLEGLPLVDLTEAVGRVARAIVGSGLLPLTAARDAAHIAAASVHDIDILLTWNCRHIANAAIIKELEAVVVSCGYELPVLCTPEELLES